MEYDKLENRNYCLDFIKGIACICVVFMHCEFPGQLGIIIQAISRFCVPFFFMVSGFFCLGCSIDKIKKKINHIWRIIVGASLFYLLFALLQYVGGAHKVFDFSLLDVGLFIFLNSPIIIAEQLWFLFALLYDYGLFYITVKADKIKWAHMLIPVLGVLYVCLAQGAVMAGVHIPKLIYRNFLTEGFLFFMLGHWLHSNEAKVRSINNTVLVAGILISTLLCVVERYFFQRDFGVNIFSFPQVFFVFIYAMNNSKAGQNHILRRLGSKCSMFVYILHPFVWHSLEYIYIWIGINKNMIALYILPVLVLGFSILFSMIIALKKRKV